MGKTCVKDMDKEIIIRQIAGSMAIEGMYLTEDDMERIREHAFDKEQIDPVVAELVEKHSKKEAVMSNPNYEEAYLQYDVDSEDPHIEMIDGRIYDAR